MKDYYNTTLITQNKMLSIWTDHLSKLNCLHDFYITDMNAIIKYTADTKTCSEQKNIDIMEQKTEEILKSYYYDDAKHAINKIHLLNHDIKKLQLKIKNA